MTFILKLVVKQKTVHIENYVWYCSVNIKPNVVTFQFLLHVISEEENLYLYLAQLLQLSLKIQANNTNNKLNKYKRNTLSVEMKTMKTKERV